jgi:hypothetical protein
MTGSLARTALALGLSATLTLGASAQSSVLVVDANGSPGSFLEIQAAVESRRRSTPRRTAT